MNWILASLFHVSIRRILYFSIFTITITIAAADGHASLDDNCVIFGEVVCKDGKPVKGAKVAVTCDEHDFKKTVETGSDGIYMVDKLKSGYYHVTLSKRLIFYPRQKRLNIYSDREFKVDFIHLNKSSAVYGVLLDLEAKPIPACHISIDNLRYHKIDRFPRIHKKTSTDDRGFFIIENLCPGTFEFTLNRHNLLYHSPGGVVNLQMGISKEVTISMHPGIVNGKLKIEGGNPHVYGSIKVTAKRKGEFNGTEWTTSISVRLNTFEINNLPAGKYEAEAYLKGYYCKPVGFRIPKKSKPKDIMISLLIAGSIFIKITDLEGNPHKMLEVVEIIPGKGQKRIPTEKIGLGEFRIYASPGEHEYRFDIPLRTSIKGEITKRIEVIAKKEVVVYVEH